MKIFQPSLRDGFHSPNRLPALKRRAKFNCRYATTLYLFQPRAFKLNLMQKVEYLGLQNCYRLSNATVELIVTTDVGPRILRYAFIGGENILGESPDTVIPTRLGEWRPFGGHRLWTAPEDNPRSYAPDNNPINFEVIADHEIRLTKPADVTQIEKEMRIVLDSANSGVTIEHYLRNRGDQTNEIAPWGITVMNSGGEAILPQEPYRSWDEYLLPARPLVLWHYTDLSDPRWTFSQRYVRLQNDVSRSSPQKIGAGNKQGWAAYLRKKTLFVKKFSYEEGARYADFGSNCEMYTAGSSIEVESLGPLTNLGPGESVMHVERWQLFDGVDFEDIESLTADRDA